MRATGKYPRFPILVATGVIFAFAIPIPQSNAQVSGQDEVPYLISSDLALAIRNNSRAAEQYVELLYGLSPSGIVTPETIDTRLRFDRSQARARAISRILAHDLDGDLEVTEQEVDLVAPFQDGNQLAWIRTQMTLGDADGNQGLSIREMTTLFADMPEAHNVRSRGLGLLMEFDEDADGKVTADEILSIVERVAGGDPVVTLPQAPRPGLRDAEAVCTLPAPGKDAEVLFISGYEGSFVSSVAAESQDRETSLARLVIEPGDAPLYVVATAFASIVWQFTGATERIERVVVSDGRGVGIVGVDEDRVEVVQGVMCLPKYVYKQGSQELARAKAVVSARLKRQIDHTYVSYDLGEIVLPSGLENLRRDDYTALERQVFIRNGQRHVETEDGLVPVEGPNADRKLIAEIAVERMLRRYYPGGVADLEADDVVSKRHIAAYEILPQQAGLLQLVRSGHLEFVASDRFRIARTFSRFPAGLNGGHGVTFLMVPGVEMPSGSPGHSTVIAEDTGSCLIGQRCR